MTGFMTLIVSLAVFFLVVLVCREIACWYAKINERIELQRDILNQLKAMNAKHKNGDD